MRINIFRSYFCTWGGAGGGGRARQHSQRRGGRATNPENRHSTPTQPPTERRADRSTPKEGGKATNPENRHSTPTQPPTERRAERAFWKEGGGRPPTRRTATAHQHSHPPGQRRGGRGAYTGISCNYCEIPRSLYFHISSYTSPGVAQRSFDKVSLRGPLIPHEGKGLLFMYLGISAIHRGGFAGMRRLRKNPSRSLRRFQ